MDSLTPPPRREHRALLEALQGLTSYRTAEAADLLVNAAAVVVALVVRAGLVRGIRR